MNPKATKKPNSGLEKEHKVNAHYRHSILQAIEMLHDYQTRSNIDAIRRHCQDLFESEEEDHHIWNEIIFLKTLKSVVRDGDVEQCTNSSAALSSTFKKKRAISVSRKLEEKKQTMLPKPPVIEYHPVESLKDAPKRRTEHEKWKIIPKKIYDKSTIVNPMDTH